MASLDDPANPNGRLIAAGQVSGSPVYSPDGARLGSIEDLMIDKPSGRIAYAVLSFGGFLGIGDKHHPMPWTALHYDQQLGGYVVNTTRDAIEGAPSYAPGGSAGWDHGWEGRVDDYYGTPPGFAIA